MSSTRLTPLPITHKQPYAAVSPDRPELSQAGKTVLVTGGGSGIGSAIAKSFAQAGASAIVLVGRREEVMQLAAQTLREGSAKSNPQLQVHIFTVDITDSEDVAKLWSRLAESAIVIDVLVLNAGRQSVVKTVLELGSKEVFESFKVNVFGHMEFIEHLYKQDRSNSSGPAVVINVSTAAAWDLKSGGPVPVYCLTKNSGTMLLQQIAQDVPREKMRIVSFHPGLVRTETTKGLFPDKGDGEAPWYSCFSSAELPGNFAVWLASPEAAFLHGLYVEASWDVEELKSGQIREQIENDPYLLKVGILGCHP
ncbi:unnamed protein product [Clonostachys rosea f. rosea IK726]|uniref:Uncharacterized protein n=1 Tax=Clonostachys rosea f. rosea IK726 TaxID=1349383 RepID=A0ACA9UU46_BIOOC|nr:unnamed protein product [Clonostachys rosea f. rosea IK726]